MREEELGDDGLYVFCFLYNIPLLEGGRSLSLVAPRPPLLLHVEGGGGASIVFWR